MRHRRRIAALLLLAATSCSDRAPPPAPPATTDQILGGLPGGRLFAPLLAVRDGIALVASAATAQGDANVVNRVAIDGGPPLTLASNEAEVSALALEGGFAYWLTATTSSKGTVRRASLNGGGATTIATVDGQDSHSLTRCFATDGQFVFVAASTHGLRRIDMAGGTITDLIPSLERGSCTVKDGWAYYSSGGTDGPQDNGVLARVRTTGGPVDTLSIAFPARELLVIGDTIFGLDGWPPGANRPPRGLRSMPTSGGPVVTRLSELEGESGLVGDARALYVRALSAIIRVDRTNYRPDTVISGTSVGAVAIDDTHMIWIENFHQIMRTTR